MTVYFNGRYMDRDEVRISPDDRGFVFGDGVYEVIRTYDRRLFRLESHLARLSRSLSELRIAYKDVQGLGAVCAELLARNTVPTKEATVYLQITRGAAPRYHAFPSPETPPTVYACARPLAADEGAQREGIKAILVSDNRWGRCDIKSVALLANVLAFQRALDQGAQEAVFVRDGLVTEGSHANAFAVIDGIVRTAPLSGHVLPGITREVVLEVCAAEGIRVDQGPLPEKAFIEAQEAFITGTGAEIMPVVRLGDRPVGDGKPGPVTRRLQRAFDRFVASL
jgi:D-alanine transaminase